MKCTASVLINHKVDKTAQEYLQRYRDISARVRALEDAIERQRLRATSCTSQLKPVIVTGTPQKDPMADAVCNMMDIQSQLSMDKSACEQALFEIRQAIASVPSERRRTILTLHYVCGYSWDRVSLLIPLARSSVLVEHGRALKEIRDFLQIQDENGLCSVL